MSRQFKSSFISVDCVVFGFSNDNQLNVLLAEREIDGNKKQRKLPGSLIYDSEDVDEAAARVLFELTGIKKMALKQFKCFADPERAKDQEDIIWMGQEYKREIDRIVTVAYLSLCKIDHKINSTKYSTVDWFPLHKIPVLPFDHNKIIIESKREIGNWIKSDFSTIFELLPKKFTIRQLHQLFNAVNENFIDIKNFHKKISALPFIVPLEEVEKNVPHRAARYYRFDDKMYRKNNSRLIK